MKVVKKVLLFAILLGFLFQVKADCCRRTRVSFKLNDPINDSCRNYDADLAAMPPHFVDTEILQQHRRCEIQVCGDGEKPGEGIYCGIGACNLFGCNCDDGCIPGDPVESLE
uniref:Protein Diedel-like n=1 Tax=Megaselia scalaris TaxID=36166 RepID=T1GZE7_MEGSC